MARRDLDVFFNPSSVAIVGASPKRGKVGHVILANFVRGFRGKVFAVNPKYKEILGVPCYPRVTDIPEPVDLAVIAVRAHAVPEIVADCVKKGVKGIVIISGGFSEIGPEGAELERKIIETVKGTGIRIIGPNCLGVYNAYTGVDTFFLPEGRMKRPPAGPIAIISQSGAFAAALLDWAAQEGIGISKVVSYGNKIDVDDVDLIEYFGEDPDIKVITIYIEGIKPGRGRLFIDAAKKVIKEKAIIVLKGGKTKSGTAAAASHTAALSSDYAVFSAAMRQAGILEATSFEDMFDMAVALAKQPPARGPNVAVITNAGGLGVLAADALESLGLKLPRLSPESVAELRDKMPPYVSLRNPIDLVGDATDERYSDALDVVLRDPNVDMAIVIALLQVPGVTLRLADVIASKAREYGKPVLAVTVGGKFVEIFIENLEDAGIPTYTTPERAARAAWALYKYGMIKRGEQP